MKDKLRIMLDTNILISTAIFSSSKMLAVIEYIKENHYLVLSSYVLDELNTVVKRKFINKYEKVEEFLNSLTYDIIMLPKKHRHSLI